jgi:hypothetical protein
LEAALGIARNSSAEVLAHGHLLGWEIKQHTVADFDRVEAGTITLMTPEPSAGARRSSAFSRERGVEAFVRQFGYADKRERPDRLNFGGQNSTPRRQGAKLLRQTPCGWGGPQVAGSNRPADLFNSLAPLRLCVRKTEPKWQYAYDDKVRLAQRTDSLRLLRAFASGAMYYDPGIKLENASTEKAKSKKRSQFRVASRNITALYETVETVAV